MSWWSYPVIPPLSANIYPIFPEIGQKIIWFEIFVWEHDRALVIQNPYLLGINCMKIEDTWSRWNEGSFRSVILRNSNLLFKEIIVIHQNSLTLSPSRRREAPCEGTNSPRLFTPGETKALGKSKVHQLSQAWVTNDGWSSHWVILTDLKNMADCHE